MPDDFGNTITNEQLLTAEVIVDYDAPAQVGPFDSITFVIKTGGDDLREDSGLTATVSFSIGTSASQVLTLKTKGSLRSRTTLLLA
jgi:hypothetical protein